MRKTLPEKSETDKCHTHSPTHRARKPCLDVLRNMPEGFATKLKTVIEHDHPYFILTGSDPVVERGCCPSNDVGAANRLVKAGILDSCAPSCHPDACPATLYAFAGEIVAGAEKPAFQINRELRQDVLRCLEHIRSPRFRLPLCILRWILLGFAACTVAFVIFDEAKQFRERDVIGRLQRSQALAEALRRRTGVAVCYFYGADKCEFCTNMRAYTKKALNIHFADPLQTRELVFVEVDRDDPANRALRKKYGIFTSSILFVEFEHGQERRVKLVEEAWNAGLSEEKFIEMIRNALTSFLEIKDE